MKLIPCTSAADWDDYVQKWDDASFLQSWSWGTFQKRKGSTPLYVFLKDGEVVHGASLIVVVHSKRGTYFECIGGPLLANGSQEMFTPWFKAVSELGREYGAMFIRVRLPVAYNTQDLGMLRTLGFKPTTLYYQAELTRMIDISQPEEAISSQMKKKTRYEIRRTEREGVEIEKFTQDSHVFGSKELDDALNAFLQLYHQMVERQHYVGYSDLYLRTQFEIFFQSGQASLYLAKYQGKYVAASIFFHYAKTTVYHHSASLPHSKLTAPSLILWHAIKDAQTKGHTLFDLFGIAPPLSRYDSRIGLSKFKAGFGGYEFQWMRTHDYVYRPMLYRFNQWIEKMPSNIRTSGRNVLSLLRH